MAAPGVALVSKDVAAGLKAAGGSGLTVGAFKHLCAAAVATAARSDSAPSEEALLGSEALAGVAAAAAKTVFASLATFVLECARRGATPATVRSALADYGMDADRATFVAHQFEASLPALQTVLASTDVPLQKIVDVEWRLDYQVNNSSTGREHDPLYIIKLKTLTGTGETRDVEFTATQEQLRDLLTRARDATDTVDKLVGAKRRAGHEHRDEKK